MLFSLPFPLSPSAPIVMIAGTCMNSGKTVAATEIIKQAANAGLRVAGAKLSGIACLRDTLHMQDHGAIATASFLDCGLPSTVDYGDLAPVAKSILNHLNGFEPELIVVELGDGIVGGYAVDSVLKDREIKAAISSFVFCASDYVGVIGGISVLKDLGIEIDVIAGSVTDSQMGEDFVREQIGLEAGNAHRDGARLFELASGKMSAFKNINAPTQPGIQGPVTCNRQKIRRRFLAVRAMAEASFCGYCCFILTLRSYLSPPNEHAGKGVSDVHRNLLGLTDLRFTTAPDDLSAMEDIDAAFFALPHGQAMDLVPETAETRQGDRSFRRFSY